MLTNKGSTIRATEIRVLDNLTYSGTKLNFMGLDKDSFQFIKGDICDSTTAIRATKGIDVVVHFAAESHVDRSITGPLAFVQTNVVGTGVLLDSSLKNQVKTFIHVSTDEVYGSRNSGSFLETDPLNPSSPYSSSKAGSDLLAISYYKTYEMDVRITRACNNFGPRQYPEKIIPLFITKLINREKIPLYGNGLNVRDWIHVEDHCRALEIVIKNGSPGEIYNISGSHEITNYELSIRLLNEFDRDNSWLEYVKDRRGHDYRYSIGSDKLRGLGYVPEVNFDSGIKTTISWYKENIDWWTSIQASLSRN